MAKSRLLLVLVIAFAGLVAWLANADPLRLEPPQATSSRDVTPATAPVVAAPPVEREASVAAEPREVPSVESGEWTDISWSELQREVAHNELEVRVLRARQPVSGVQVRVWPASSGRACEPCFGAEPPHFVGRTDTDGIVRFERVPAGEFAVRADAGEDFVCDAATVGPVPQAGTKPRTVVLLFGTASIVGTVVDAEGVPRVDVPVHLSGIGPLPPRFLQTRTDRVGHYRFGAVHSGRYNVQIEPPGAWSAEHDRMVTLRPGEAARMDFGPVGPQFELRGRVVDGNGQHIPGRRSLRLREAQHNDERCVLTDADGAYSVALPAGNWSIVPMDTARPPATATSVELTRSPTELPVRWPGIRVLVHVHADAALDPAEGGNAIWLEQQRPDLAFEQGGVLVLQWLECAPGAFRLLAHNGLRFVDAPAEGVAVTLDEKQPVVQLHVNVARMR